MKIEIDHSKRSKVLIFTEDDKFLVTVDAIVGDLVTNTIAIQSVVSSDNRKRYDILEDDSVIAIVDVSSVEQAEKDIDTAVLLVQNPGIILVVHDNAGPIEPLVSRVQTVLPLEQLKEMLHSVVRLVQSGMCVVPAPMLQCGRELTLPTANNPDVERLGSLSPTETRVLLGLLEGLSNKHIARQIAISDNTVRVHIRNIFLKLGVSNRTQAALLANRYRNTSVLRDSLAATETGRFRSHANMI